MKPWAQILVNASERISGRPWSAAENLFLPDDFVVLLQTRNGFYAYDSALLVRPISNGGQCPRGVLEWNNEGLWKNRFGSPPRMTFFAEDLFGVQFGFTLDANVVSWDPETGQVRQQWRDFEHWCREIVNDCRVLTGLPLAQEWQYRNGPMLPGFRLLPKRPFVLGGRFEIDNLYQLEELEAMHYRASLANQLLDVPDGSRVIITKDAAGKSR